MVRHIAQVATLGFALIFAASGALRAQDQKGTLVFAVESLGAQTLDPILEGRPGNAVYDVRRAGRLQSGKRRHRSRRRRTLGTFA